MSTIYVRPQGALVGGFASSTSIPEGALILVAGAFVTWQAVEFVVGLRRAPSRSTSSSLGQVRIVSKLGVIGGMVGLAVGLIGGAVGLILGSVRLPVIVRFLRMDPRTAAGSNLVIGTLMGVFGFIGHGVQGEVDLPLLVVMGLAGMTGAYIGAQFTGRASPNVILATMSLVLFIVGVLLIRDGITRWAQ